MRKPSMWDTPIESAESPPLPSSTPHPPTAEPSASTIDCNSAPKVPNAPAAPRSNQRSAPAASQPTTELAPPGHDSPSPSSSWVTVRTEPQPGRPSDEESVDHEDLDESIGDAIGSVDNAPSLGIHHAGLTIDGYSRAAVQTYWRIAELKLGFDLGAQPWDFMALPKYFISHSHLDHIAALPSYVARRRMMKMEPPTIYLPDHTLATVDQMLRVVSRLDRGRLPCRLIPITPNQEIEISRELVVTTAAMRHSIPALGFIVWERRKKLKPEYTQLTGDQIRDLKLSGVEVTHEIRMPLVAYTGDTAPAGLDDCPDMYRAKILITEMTFVAPEHRRERIHKHGHMHLDDFVDRRDTFQNELILCGHFSVRYNDQQIRRWVDRALPDRLDGRLKLWL